jgi:hypothetical protein
VEVDVMKGVFMVCLHISLDESVDGEPGDGDVQVLDESDEVEETGA